MPTTIKSDSYSLKAEVTQNENYSFQALNQYSPKTIEVGTDVIRVEITDSGGATKLALLPGETKTYSGTEYSFIDGVVTSQYSWYNQGMKTFKVVYKELTYTWEYMSTQTVEQATKDASGNVITDTYATKTELAGKANSSHTHNYAGSSSAGGAATKAISDGSGNNIVNTYMPKAGGTFTGAITGPNFRIPVGQPNTVKDGDIWIG